MTRRIEYAGLSLTGLLLAACTAQQTPLDEDNISQVELELVAACVGDMNLDGVVDNDDVNAIVEVFNGARPCVPQMDGDDDGDCDFDDIAFLSPAINNGTCALDPCSADLNGNGTVDSADYTIWRDNYGCSSNCSAGDVNGDGTVDGADYLAWASSFGTTGCFVPSQGNVLIWGAGNGSVWADQIASAPGGDSFVATAILADAGDVDPSDDVFPVGPDTDNFSAAALTRLGPDGRTKWVAGWRGDSEDADPRIHDLAVDNSGNVYVLGDFHNTLSLNPNNSGSKVTLPASVRGMFLVKLDAEGRFEWAHTVAGSAAGSLFNPARVIVEGNWVYLSGQIYGATDLDPTSGVDIQGTNDREAVIIALDVDGNYRWAHAWGAGFWMYPSSIAVGPSGIVYVTANGGGSGDIVPGAGVGQYTSDGTDAFLYGFDVQGNLIGLDIAGGPGNNFAGALNVMSDGGLAYIGHAIGAGADVAFGSAVVPTQVAQTGFVVRLNGWGQPVYTHLYPDAAFTEARSTAGDSLVVIGTHAHNADVDPGPGVDLRPTNGSSDPAAFSFAHDGTLSWSTSWGSSGSDGMVFDLALQPDGFVAIVGAVEDSADYEPGPGQTLVGGTNRNAYQLRLRDSDGLW